MTNYCVVTKDDYPKWHLILYFIKLKKYQQTHFFMKITQTVFAVMSP